MTYLDIDAAASHTDVADAALSYYSRIQSHNKPTINPLVHELF